MLSKFNQMVESEAALWSEEMGLDPALDAAVGQAILEDNGAFEALASFWVEVSQGEAPTSSDERAVWACLTGAFGQMIRQGRSELSETSEDLESATGIDGPMIQGIEGSKVNPGQLRPGQLGRLLEHLRLADSTWEPLLFVALTGRPTKIQRDGFVLARGGGRDSSCTLTRTEAHEYVEHVREALSVLG